MDRFELIVCQGNLDQRGFERCMQKFFKLSQTVHQFRWRWWDIGCVIEEAPRSPYLVDRKSTRLNSSHSSISYAGFCFKNKDYIFGKELQARKDYSEICTSGE